MDATRLLAAGDPPDVSLLQGWLPTTVQVLALLLAVVMVARPGRKWWLVWVPAATAVGVAVACGSRWYSNSQGMSGAPLPWILWVWFGLASAAVVVAAVGWTFGRHCQQAVAVAAVLVSLLSAGAVLNQYTGYVRTVKQAYAEAVDSPLPGEVPLGSLQGVRGHVPASGALVRMRWSKALSEAVEPAPSAVTICL